MTNSLRLLIIALALFFTSSLAFGQATNANGVWADGNGAIWAGGSAPGTGWTTININNTVTRASGWNVSGTLNVNASSSLTISGNVTVTGGSTLNVYGTLRITGNVTLNSNLRVFPGGLIIVDNSVNVVSSNYLTIGTNVAAPPNADMIIKGNLNSISSGDITVNQNGRLAVYGDLTASTGGGSFITINNGGQAYIGGDLIFPGGGDAVNNNNTGGSIGLYIDGVVSVTGGGSSVGGEEAQGGYASSDYLLNTEGGGDNDFYGFLEAAEGSPLPVELLYFTVASKKNYVEINWSTATEINNDYFTIEKSLDGSDFIKVLNIEGSGNSSDPNAYQVMDDQISSKLIYYRLSQTDYDGSVSYLGLKSINMTLPSKLSFYPSIVPVGGEITFDAVVPSEVSVYNNAGQLVMTQTMANNKLAFTNTLKSGVYIIQSTLGDQIFSNRIILK